MTTTTSAAAPETAPSGSKKPPSTPPPTRNASSGGGSPGFGPRASSPAGWLPKLSAAGALLLAALVGAAYWNVRKNFPFTRYMEGLELLKPKDWRDLALFAAGGAALWGLAWWKLRRAPGFLALLPAAVGGLAAALVAEEWFRERQALAVWFAGVGLSLAVALWHTGTLVWAERKIPMKARRFVRRWGGPAGLCALMIASAFVSAWYYKFSCKHLQHLWSDAYDIANLHQSMWTLAENGVSTATVMKYSDVEELGHRWWAEHFTPVQFLMLPFYAPFRSIESMLFLQFAAHWLGLIPLALALRIETRRWSLGLALAAAYAFHPLVTRALLNGFHYEVFFPPLFFLAYWFYAKRWMFGFSVALMLAFTVKETLGVYVLPWGVALALFDKERRKWGLLIMGLSALHFVLAMKIVLSLYRDGAMHRAAEERYHWIFEGRDLPPFESAGDLVKACLTYPMDTLGSLFHEYRWHSPFRLLTPLAFLCFMRPWTIAIFAPAAAITMLSNWPFQAEFRHYHSMEVLPLVMVATASAIREPWLPGVRGGGKPRRLRALLIIPILLAGYGAWQSDSQLPGGGRYAKLPPVLWRDRVWAMEVYDILAEVPSDAHVSASYYLCPPVSGREWLHLIPRVDPTTDVILVVKYGNIKPSHVPGNTGQLISEFVLRLLNSGEWRLARPYDATLGLLWLERGGDGQPVKDGAEIHRDMFLEVVAPWEVKDWNQND